jgi:hypothetical protein
VTETVESFIDEYARRYMERDDSGGVAHDLVYESLLRKGAPESG